MFLRRLKHQFRVKTAHGLLALALLVGGVGVFLTQNRVHAALAQNIKVNGTGYSISANPGGTGWKIQGGDLILTNFNGQSIEVDGAIKITLEGESTVTEKLTATNGKVIISGAGTLTVNHTQKSAVAANFAGGLLVESGKLVVTNANFQTDIEDAYAGLSVDNGFEVQNGATVEVKVVVPADKAQQQKAIYTSGLLKVAGNLTAELTHQTSVAGELHAIHSNANIEVTTTGMLKASAPDKAIQKTSGQYILAEGVRIAEPKTHKVAPNKQSIVPGMPSELEIRQAPEPTFTVSQDPSMTNGSVLINPATASEGQQITVTAQPNPGYRLKSMSYIENRHNALEQAITGGKFNMPRSDVKVMAVFELAPVTTYELFINCSYGGKCDPSGVKSYPAGTIVTLKFTPGAGQRVKSVSAPAVRVDDVTYTILMDSSKTIKVEFESIPKYNLNINCGTGGTCNPTGTKQYNAGETATITITPEPGKRVKQVTGATKLNDTTYTVVMNGPKTVTVEFEAIKYTLTIDCGSGGTCAPPVPTEYEIGTTATITLEPAPDKRVKSVSAPAVRVNDTTYTVVMDGPKTITVEFEQIKHNLTVNCGVGGTCDPTGVNQYNAGETVTITVTPEGGKRVKSVTGATKQTNTTYEVTMDGPKVVNVEFETIPVVPPTVFNITKGAMMYGDVEISKNQAAKDEQITVTPKPEQGYKLKKLTYTPAGDSAMDITTALKFNMLEKAVEINAEFELMTFALTINCGAGGTCAPSAIGPHSYGTEVTITLAPEANKKVKTVTGATKQTDTTYKVVMHTAKTVSVEFEDKSSTLLAPAPAIEVDKPAIKQDEEITVSVDNLTAYEGQELEVWLHSNPKLVGKFTVLAGKASLKFKIPCDVAAGAHTIYVKSGNTNVLSQAITVAAGNACVKAPGAPNTGYRPGQVSAVAIMAGLASLAGFVIAIKKRA